VSVLFSTIGGLIGAALFRAKTPPPGPDSQDIVAS